MAVIYISKWSTIERIIRECTTAWICIRCGSPPHLGYLSHVLHGQCTMSSLLAQSSFEARGSSSPVSPAEQVQMLIPQLRPRAPTRILRAARIPVLFYNLDEPIRKALRRWDFQSASYTYALQSAYVIFRDLGFSGAK